MLHADGCMIFRRLVWVILTLTILVPVTFSTFPLIRHVEAQVCNFTNIRTQYPTILHATETFQVLVQFTAGCDYSGQIVLRVNLIDERTNQILSTASWPWFRSYNSTIAAVSPWLQLDATAPNTPGYWPLMLYAYNLDGEGSTSSIPFQIQVL